MLAARLSVPATTIQELSREDARREAGRLGTEAERLRGEAYKKVQAGGDRRLITEAERAVAEKFRRAVELWRAAGDDDRLMAGVEELTRIYSVAGDYDGVTRCLRREAEYWGGRGDLARQIRTLRLMGIRQLQMRRDEAAAGTFERVVEMSRGAGLVSVERNALDDLARLYDKFGRREEAEQLRATAKGLWSQTDVTLPDVIKPSKPAVIPAQWIDLPSAPLAAEYRDVEGLRQAVLVNRSTKGVEMVMFGCVAEEDGKVQVLYGLIGMGQNHGGVGPGSYYMPFSALNGPLNQWADEKMGCEGAAKMAVTEAGFADRTRWKADGTDWITR
jgi:tetratricopeptide (TPR) repeat protein